MVYQFQLFESDNLHLPSPIEGESLYSWCIRFHRLCTNTKAKQTIRQLFGHASTGARHDFPTRLGHFSTTTQFLLGTIEELIYERTVFSIFAPFLTQDAVDDVIRNMRDGQYSRIAYRIGLRGIPTFTVAPLKACAICINEDRVLHGSTYWHIEHQFPTSLTCTKHGSSLLVATQIFHAEIQHWNLPSDIPLSGWMNYRKPDAREIILLNKLSEWSLWVSRIADRNFEEGVLRRTYLLRAKSMGWTHSDGKIDFERIRVAFRKKYANLEPVPGFSFVKDTWFAHGGFLGEILLSIGNNKHPLRNLLVMDFLFDSHQTFLSEYDRVCDALAQDKLGNLWSDLVDSTSLLKMLVSDAGFTVNTAAQKLHIPVQSAIRRLRRDGVAFQQNRRIALPTEEAMTSFLLDGDSLDEIALKLQIKKHQIISYLTKHPDLQISWRQAVQKKEIEKHRSMFLQFLSDNPNIQERNVRRTPESGFRWLKENDIEWLHGHLPGIWNQR